MAATSSSSSSSASRSLFSSFRPVFIVSLSVLSTLILTFIVWTSYSTFTSNSLKSISSTSTILHNSAPNQVDIAQLQATINTLQKRVTLLEKANREGGVSTLNSTSPLAIANMESAWSPLRYQSVSPPSAVAAFAKSPYVRYAVATLISLDAHYCHAAWVWYKSMRLQDPTGRYDYLIMFSKEQVEGVIDINPYCKALKKYTAPSTWNADDQRKIPVDERQGYVWFTPIDVIPLQGWHRIGSDAWRYSLNRLEVFKMDQYERVVYLDADMIAYQNFDELFRLTTDLSGIADQWDGCNVRRTLNGGVLSFRPSYYLYRAAIDLFNKNPSCLSKTFIWSDQEVINCMCGFAGLSYPERAELQCSMLAPYINISPRDFQCSYFRDMDSILVHFATYPKPWTWKQDNCVPEAKFGVRNQSIDWYRQRRSCYTGVESFFTLWHCYDNGGSLDLEMPDCLLIHV
jgi:hypothetical protein